VAACLAEAFVGGVPLDPERVGDLLPGVGAARLRAEVGDRIEQVPVQPLTQPGQVGERVQLPSPTRWTAARRMRRTNAR
jgi:hypothetical protein